jgi:hypothetical protein
MTMCRPSRFALAAVAAAALAAAALSACGNNSGLLPSSRASALEDELDQVAAGVRSGNCTAAEQAVSRVQGELLNLPRSTDAALRRRLQEGVDNLRARVPAACQQGASGTEASPSQSETPSTDEKNKKKTDTTGTGTTTGQTTPPTTETGQTQPPTDTGQTQTQGTGTSTQPGATGGASPGNEGGGK